MDLEILDNKVSIFNFLKRNPGLNIYSIGDLDDFYWPKTTWYAMMDGNTVFSIAMLYEGQDIPTLLLFYDADSKSALQLLIKIKSLLPFKFNAHFSPGLKDLFGRQNIIKDYGVNYKMILKKVVKEPDYSNINKLTTNDLSKIENFYTYSYAENWFDPCMLETNMYYGYFLNDILVGVSGIHVFSKKYKVAALGNIAVHPDFRGQLIGYKITSVLCYELQKCVDIIGLNVKADNEFAIRCYKKVGFEIIGTYDECCIENNFKS